MIDPPVISRLHLNNQDTILDIVDGMLLILFFI